MSKFTNDAKKVITHVKPVAKVAVGVTHNVKHASTNKNKSYEGGNIYDLDPIASLRLMAASSVFGEPSYYETSNMRANKMESVIDAALNYDFGATLQVAVEMRTQAWMRLNPQIILVRAAIHPKRAEFTAKNPGVFNAIQDSIVRRPDDITSQVEYYIAKNKSAKKLPGILKRSAAYRLNQFGAYHVRKYANRGIGLIDVVRLTHANSDAINQLMKEGKVVVNATEVTWKELRSAGKDWEYIVNESGISLSHSDLLYQMRAIFSDVSASTAKKVSKQFLAGVAKGNIWPYKYFIAYKQLSSDTFANKPLALSTLSQAIEQRLTVSKYDGTVAVLVDVSGSMQSTIPVNSKAKSDAEGMKVSELAALSAAIAAKQFDSAYFVPFGTNAVIVPVDNTRSAFDLAADMDNDKMQRRYNVGHGTNMDVAIRALENANIHVDHIFVYSDMQSMGSVTDAIRTYRKKINPKASVFTIQVAGYDNSVQPANSYRSADLAGWTGKEVEYAIEITNIWNEVEA